MCRSGLTDFSLATFLIEVWNADLPPGRRFQSLERSLLETGSKRPSSSQRRNSSRSFIGLWMRLYFRRLFADGALRPQSGLHHRHFHRYRRRVSLHLVPRPEPHTPKTKRIYLSLGDAEEKTRNRTIATVGDCIWEQALLLDKINTDKTR